MLRAVSFPAPLPRYFAEITTVVLYQILRVLVIRVYGALDGDPL